MWNFLKSWWIQTRRFLGNDPCLCYFVDHKDCEARGFPRGCFYRENTEGDKRWPQ